MADLPVVGNWISDSVVPAISGAWLTKESPVTGLPSCRVARSEAADVETAMLAAKAAQPAWERLGAVARSDLLRATAQLISEQRDSFAACISEETGKSRKDALGEVMAAVEMGFFVAGEGRRGYGRTTSSAIASRMAFTLRQPMGVAGLIVAANTPIANVAWKAFPALLCGNAAVLKASEDTPRTALLFAQAARQAGLPTGILAIVQGAGAEAGAALVESRHVQVISFTGSTAVGRWIQEAAGRRLTKVCLELGGKNALVVLDDADLELALRCALLSAFSNAGQRCAAGSRIVVTDKIYDRFASRLTEAAMKLRVGSQDGDDLGPVINRRQHRNILAAVEKARSQGCEVLCGGGAPAGLDAGFHIAPTILASVARDQDISRQELFGPVTCLYRARDPADALAIADDADYALTTAIHTKDINLALAYMHRIRSGVVSVNGNTHGSEPHMPFGGPRSSGTGWREAGTEALDVYSDIKTVYVAYDQRCL